MTFATTNVIFQHTNTKEGNANNNYLLINYHITSSSLILSGHLFPACPKSILIPCENIVHVQINVSISFTFHSSLASAAHALNNNH